MAEHHTLTIQISAKAYEKLVLFVQAIVLSGRDPDPATGLAAAVVSTIKKGQSTLFIDLKPEEEPCTE